MDKIEQTLRMLLSLLEDGNYIYHISGGFAAHLYGATRPVNDIDIVLPQADFLRLSKALKKNITNGPSRCFSPPWDIWLSELAFEDQLVDLSGDEQGRIQHKTSGEWVPLREDFNSAQTLTKYGLTMKVQNPKDLMDYKRIISFQGDEEKHLSDAAAVERWMKSV